MKIKKNSFPLAVLTLIFALVFSSNAQGQDSDLKEESLKRHRIGLAMGHSHIPTATEIEGENSVALVPSWGLSYTYRFSERFSIGLKSDLEISKYTIEDSEGEELDRENPFSLALSIEYKFYKGLGAFIAPGIEFEDSEDLFISLIGVFYEVEINETWDLTPELIYELKGGHTGAVIFGLGVGLNL